MKTLKIRGEKKNVISKNDSEKVVEINTSTSKKQRKHQKQKEILSMVSTNENQYHDEIFIKTRKYQNKKEIKRNTGEEDLISISNEIQDESIVEKSKKQQNPRKKKERINNQKKEDIELELIYQEAQDKLVKETGKMQKKPRKKLEKIVYYVYYSPGLAPIDEIDDTLQKWIDNVDLYA